MYKAHLDNYIEITRVETHLGSDPEKYIMLVSPRNHSSLPSNLNKRPCFLIPCPCPTLVSSSTIPLALSVKGLLPVIARFSTLDFHSIRNTTCDTIFLVGAD